MPWTCPSAPALNQAPLQMLGARLHRIQNGGRALLRHVNASPWLTVAVPDGQVTPIPFPPQPSSKKSLSVREFPEEPECESLVRAEAGSNHCWLEIALGLDAQAFQAGRGPQCTTEAPSTRASSHAVSGVSWTHHTPYHAEPPGPGQICWLCEQNRYPAPRTVQIGSHTFTGREPVTYPFSFSKVRKAF